MIRIAHVTNQLDTGGMERLLVEFARHADRTRFGLEFVCLGGRGPIAEQLESIGWPVRVLAMRPGLRPTTVFELARYFRWARTDLVHTHNTKPLLYAAPAARLAGVPGLVHTRHGQRIGASKRQDAAFRLACRTVDRVVCVSDATLRASIDEKIPVHGLHAIPNGIDLERFTCAGPQQGAPALFVGRLNPDKGVDVLIRAAALVCGRVPEFRVRIAGCGPSRSSLHELAKELGIEDRVEFLGDVPDVLPYLRHASMLVLPSHSEGLSLAVLEAMGVGLPVIATRVGGTPEAVVHEQTGALINVGDVEGLSHWMSELWRDPALARRMGVAGRARAESRFDVRCMVRQYEAMYNEVLLARGVVAA